MQEPSLNAIVSTLKTSRPPTPEERFVQLEKILNSQVFHGSEILKSFLRFVVGKSLEGLESEVKEYTIATEVFGRNANYDPRIDSLVRVQAARLRSKLQEYYTSEGKNDGVHIDLPKGHYIPAFTYIRPDSRSHQRRASDLLKVVGSPPAIPRSGKDSLFRFSRRFLTAGLSLISLVLAIVAYRYYMEAKQFRQYAISNRVDLTFVQDIAPFWAEFLNTGSPLLVAYSNPVFRGNLANGLKYWAPLEASTPTLRPPSLSRVVDSPAVTDIYTGVGEVMGVNFLGNLFWKVGNPFRVERSLLLTWEDLKAQNIVFLGGPSENLLLRRLPQEQDFVYRIDGTKGGFPKVVILNRRARPNEQRSYAPSIEGPSQSMVTEDYALISMLRGLEPNRRLLILAGITTFGTQACAEYVTEPESLKELIKHLNTSKGFSQPKLPPYYQVLLKVKINGSVPIQTSYVTHHVLD